MKTLITGLFLFFLFITNANTSVAANSSQNTHDNYKGSDCKPGIIIVRVKPQFKSFCSPNGISESRFIKAMAAISTSSVSKKFPQSKTPEAKLNRYGKKPLDMTLIYQLEFSPVVKLDEAINILKSSGVVEYAEPLYIQYMDFTPNDPSINQQYALNKISAYTAWDVWTGDTNVVIGIVDSGTDWDHPDLQANIKYNYADPIDNIDNDNDGFIDNFRGWDVSENDNDPMVVSSDHGSHVSGCADAVTNNGIGVAGPAYKCKFLPVKSALDASGSTIDNGYDGIVYAADHGVDVINCSWGRSGLKSQFEQETCDYATYDHDVLVIAAAGNNGIDENHFPASYDGVISVAATTTSDGRASFSSYNSSVDVSAPGNNIYSTVFNNSYTSMSGTSMASPIAAGCAAMIKSRFPSYNALQVGEHLRSTSDYIYGTAGNALYTGKLGKGRVNLFKAMTDSVSPGVILKGIVATDRHDDVFVTGDTIDISAVLFNLLKPTVNLSCSLSTTSSDVQIIQPDYAAGVINTMDTASNYSLPYKVIINQSAALNTVVTFRLTLLDGSWTDIFLFNLTINVDYVNVNVNNVSTSITSKSLIGYNLTGQQQGLGFTYNGSPTILYDMGLMIGVQGGQVSDNTRSDGSVNDADFVSVVNVSSQEPGLISDFDVSGIMEDAGSTSTAPLNILVHHKAYAWITTPDDNYVIVQYYIKNKGTSLLNNLYAGLFADWDIPAYANNKCSTDNLNRMGYIWSTDTAGLYGGIKLLSHSAGFNHYALDNTANNGGIELTDGFSNAEKFTALSTARPDAGTATPTGNDVLSVVSTGPLTIAAGDSVEVAFALMAGEKLSDLQEAAVAAQTKYDGIFIGLSPVKSADNNFLYQNYPNPGDKETGIDFSIRENNFTELTIYNMRGEKIKSVFAERLNAGRYSIQVDVSNFSSGVYLYRLVSGNFIKTMTLQIAH